MSNAASLTISQARHNRFMYLDLVPSVASGAGKRFVLQSPEFKSTLNPTTVPISDAGLPCLIADALDRLELVKVGWNGYSAQPPTMDSIFEARNCAGELESYGVSISDLGPSTLGGVGITVYESDTEYAIEFLNNGVVLVTEVCGANRVKVHKLTGDHDRYRSIVKIVTKGNE